MSFEQVLTLLLGVTAVIYTGTAIAYYVGARPGMMVTFIGYAIAQVGLIYDAIHTVPVK